MINIQEYLLGKNNKIVMPEHGCEIEELTKWVEKFGIKEEVPKRGTFYHSPFLKNEKVFYTLGECKNDESTYVAVWIVKHTGETEDDFVWLGVVLKPLYDKRKSIIYNELNPLKNYGEDIDFDDAAIIAKLMMEYNEPNKIVEILQNYRDNIN